MIVAVQNNAYHRLSAPGECRYMNVPTKWQTTACGQVVRFRAMYLPKQVAETLTQECQTCHDLILGQSQDS